MNFTVFVPARLTPQQLINRCGYATFRDPNTRETSYVRRLGSYFFPRFHVYLQKYDENGLQLSLHLDQKQPTYIKGHAHSGEYDGPTVEAEAEKIRRYAVQHSR